MWLSSWRTLSRGCQAPLAPIAEGEAVLAWFRAPDQHAAFVIGLEKVQIALALVDERESFRQCLLRLDHLRLRLAQLSFGFRRRDGGDDLSSRDLVSFVHGQLREPAGIFCRDVDLRGLDAAVRFHDSLWHIAAAQARDEGFHRCAGSFDRVSLLRLRLHRGAFLRRLGLRSPQLRLCMRG